MQRKTTKKSNSFRDLLSSSGQSKAVSAGASSSPGSGRRLKEGYTQVGANIPLKLKREVFKQLQDEGMNFSELVEKLLTGWLEKR